LSGIGGIQKYKSDGVTNDYIWGCIWFFTFYKSINQSN
jgi:hypothetical protein